jgi:hypothetical protein
MSHLFSRAISDLRRLHFHFARLRKLSPSRHKLPLTPNSAPQKFIWRTTRWERRSSRERIPADWPGALRANPKEVEDASKPQEGTSSRAGRRTRRSVKTPRCTGSSLQVGRTCDGLDRTCVQSKAIGEARGRRRTWCSSRLARRDPGEAHGRSRKRGVRRKTMLFDGEACAKGTALVAKARDDAMRDPRPQRTTRRGSSGGRARGTSKCGVRGLPGPVLRNCSGRSRGDTRLLRSTTSDRLSNPRSGAGNLKFFAKSYVEQNVRVVETTEAQSAGLGSPARKELALFADAACDGHAEGERNPMRGGSTYWARPGRYGSSWMSTGRPRVMR